MAEDRLRTHRIGKPPPLPWQSQGLLPHRRLTSPCKGMPKRPISAAEAIAAAKQTLESQGITSTGSLEATYRRRRWRVCCAEEGLVVLRRGGSLVRTEIAL